MTECSSESEYQLIDEAICNTNHSDHGKDGSNHVERVGPDKTIDKEHEHHRKDEKTRKHATKFW